MLKKGCKKWNAAHAGLASNWALCPLKREKDKVPRLPDLTSRGSNTPDVPKGTVADLVHLGFVSIQFFSNAVFPDSPIWSFGGRGLRQVRILKNDDLFLILMILVSFWYPKVGDFGGSGLRRVRILKNDDLFRF